MSLSSHLRLAESPIRAFFAARLGETGPAVRDASLVLRAGRPGPRLPAASGVNPGRAGTAVDYLLRFALAAEPCPRNSPGMLGAGMLGRDASLSAMVAVEDAMAFVAQVEPYRASVTDDQWLALTQISLMLASFEMVYRSGLPPAYVHALDRAPSPDWQSWTPLVCTEAEVEDVAVLGWAAAEDHRDLRGGSLRCNPTFVQSSALRGADADVLTDGGLLIDFKSTSTTRVCSRTDVWQVCGYALADTDDRLEITGVGISALRWRTRIAWTLSDLIEQLSGSEMDLPSLRTDFAAVVSASRARGRSRRQS